MSNRCAAALKAELWRRFGSADHPAEWDGVNYGGGKLSQRYWEYFRAIELLEIEPASVVLDIGGASPTTHGAFFASLLATAGCQVVVLDSQATPGPAGSNVEMVRGDAGDGTLETLLRAQPFTHVVSISVLEHIENAKRERLFRTLNDTFSGDRIVATFEYHPTTTFFESQLTAPSTSAMFGGLTEFYLDEVSASPVWAENAFSEGLVPLWYPIAVRLLRNPGRPIGR